MAKITETIFGYKPDLTLIKALKPAQKEIAGAKVDVEQYNNELRFVVRLPEWERDKIVLWQVQPASQDGATPSVVLSTNVLSGGADLQQSYDALLLVKNRLN